MVGEVMGAPLTIGSGAFKESSSMPSLAPVPKSRRKVEKDGKETLAMESFPDIRHMGSSSSPSSVSSTSIPENSPGMPAPGFLPLTKVSQGVIQPSPQGIGKAMKHDQHKRPPMPPEMLWQDREQNQIPRNRINTRRTAAGETSKHSSAIEQDDSMNPDAAMRSQHPIFHGQQQGFSPYRAKGERIDSMFLPDHYDPNFPMTRQYQFFAKKKQAPMKKYEDQLNYINREDREEIERQSKSCPTFFTSIATAAAQATKEAENWRAPHDSTSRCSSNASSLITGCYKRLRVQ